jgi:hypothetical protein
MLDAILDYLRKGKRYRKMAKNAPKRGHSARRGNMPAPYTKYKKKPFVYSWKKPRQQQAANDDKNYRKAA